MQQPAVALSSNEAKCTAQMEATKEGQVSAELGLTAVAKIWHLYLTSLKGLLSSHEILSRC